jgi:KaiC/GvpD/RAD55 family RecA-like ATPase
MFIKKFNIGEIKSRSKILIIGERGTGKTFLTTDILFHIHKNVPKGCIISATDSKHYANIIPPSFNYLY